TGGRRTRRAGSAGLRAGRPGQYRGDREGDRHPGAARGEDPRRVEDLFAARQAMRRDPLPAARRRPVHSLGAALALGAVLAAHAVCWTVLLTREARPAPALVPPPFTGEGDHAQHG